MKRSQTENRSMEKGRPVAKTPRNMDPELVVPTADDFNGMAVLQALAFQEKQGCESRAEMEESTRKAYRKYELQHLAKLQHCRIIKSPDDGTVMAACQLQLAGDVGDLTFPASQRHKLRAEEAYIEWIATHPHHTGKGLGSKLLKWAATYAKDTANAKVLTLGVMKANTGAVRLYERKGFVVKQDPHNDACDSLIQNLFIFCCMGCKYWTLLYMEKDLFASEKGAAPPPAAQDMTR